MAGKFPCAAILCLVAPPFRAVRHRAPGRFPYAAILCLGLAAFTLPGCERSLDLSSWNAPALVPTRIEVQRYDLAAAPPRPATTRPAKQPMVHQRVETMTIDLDSGRAAFTDVDGKTYPQQLDPDVAQKIHDLMVSGAWDTGRIKPAKDDAQPRFYTLTVFSGNQAFKDRGEWALPPRQPLPPVDALLDNTFDQLRLVAHPLSQHLNLLD